MSSYTLTVRRAGNPVHVCQLEANSTQEVAAFAVSSGLWPGCTFSVGLAPAAPKRLPKYGAMPPADFSDSQALGLK